jgi:SulP family sulfate permease
MPGLAALLIVAGFQGLRVEPAIAVWNAGKVNAGVMIATFAATLLVPLQDAVLIGMAFSILLHVFREAKQVAITQIVPVPGGLPEERPAPRDLPANELTMIQVYGNLFFAGAKYLEEMLPKVDRSTHAVVAIGLRGQTEAGSTFMSVLRVYAEALQSRDSKLMLVGVDPALRDQLAKTGVLKLIGEENVFAATSQFGGAMNKAAADAYAWLGQPPGGPSLVAPSQQR